MKAPADPSATMTHRMAKLAVIVLSALIILALIGLAGGVAWKLTGHKSRLGGDGGAGALILPPGAKIVGMDSQSGRLVLHVVSDGGEEVDIVSLDDGHLIARIKPGLRPK